MFETHLHQRCVRYTVKLEKHTRKFTCSEYGSMPIAKIAAIAFDEKVRKMTTKFNSFRRSPKDRCHFKPCMQKC